MIPLTTRISIRVFHIVLHTVLTVGYTGVSRTIAIEQIEQDIVLSIARRTYGVLIGDTYIFTVLCGIICFIGTCTTCLIRSNANGNISCISGCSRLCLGILQHIVVGTCGKEQCGETC